jgi:hypothetical protein
MRKSVFGIIAFSATLLSGGAGYAGAAGYPFGDEPYRLNWGYDPAVESGCLQWNWQQYSWYDHCPIYVHPKAYMHPRAPRAVLRTRG